jgi:hypothetical protein
MSLQKLVETYIRIPLNGDEIKTLIKREPILYEDLDKFNNLEELIDGFGYAVILMQVSSQTDGHFVAMGINAIGNPYWFDPYGMSNILVQQLSTYDKKLPDYVTPLLEDYANRHPGTRIEYNKTDFQIQRVYNKQPLRR